MCGVVGFVSVEAKLNYSESELLERTKRLSLRGPDRQSVFVSDRVMLGHARLSIIDLATGDQPMFGHDDSIVVVFNGEIYNFKELRQELQRKHIFTSKTDTEVLIHGYVEWGIDGLLDRVDGPFTFALYDKNIETTYIVRDRFGEKPLYYHNDGTKVAFASELKAIDDTFDKRRISKQGLNIFMSLSYIPAPYTIYEDVDKLEAAHYLKVDKTGVSKVRYYRLEDNISPQKDVTFDEAKSTIKELIDESIKQKMVSDVPSGAFLSGGIDSSIVVGLMSKYSTEAVKTFTIGFREKSFDESDRAQIVADQFGTDHTVHYLNFDDVIGDIDDIIDYFDEPYGDSSAIPSYYVAKLAKQRASVVLTGDCGDELFGGYEKYMASYYAKRWQAIPKPLRRFIRWTTSLVPITDRTKNILRQINKIFDFSELRDFDLMYSYMSLGFTDAEREAILKGCYFSDTKPLIEPRYMHNSAIDGLNKNMIGDVNVVLEGDMFPKGDRCGMMNSVEERIPFLSRKIVEYSLSLPSEFKIKGKRKKHILKEAYSELLPERIVNFKKRGFAVPIEYWFCNELRDELLSLSATPFLEQQGVFEPAQIQRFVEEHLSQKREYRGKLWNFYVFQKWYIKHIVNS